MLHGSPTGHWNHGGAGYVNCGRNNACDEFGQSTDNFNPGFDASLTPVPYDFNSSGQIFQTSRNLCDNVRQPQNLSTGPHGSAHNWRPPYSSGQNTFCEALLGSVSIFKEENPIKRDKTRLLSYCSKELAHHSSPMAGLPVPHLSGMNQNFQMPINCSPSYHTPHRQHILNSTNQRSDSQANTQDWVNFINLHQLDDASTRFQYILGAATSPAVKIDEEALTYLNQGQSYEVKLKRLVDHTGDHFLKSIVRVVFHERRLQYMEKEQMEHWKMVRPGERILDLDIPISYGVFDVKIDNQNVSCIEFTWDPDSDTGIYIKVNCISTEFTAKKHGGEKGVPFRVQIETYSTASNNNGEPSLLHSASCQVKVFKPKGADRKHKTDREKIEKLSGPDRDKYQTSFEYTVLSEIPVEQVNHYLQQLQKQQDLDSMGFVKEERSISLSDISLSCRPDSAINRVESSSRSVDLKSPYSNSLTPKPSNLSLSKKLFRRTPLSPCSPASPTDFTNRLNSNLFDDIESLSCHLQSNGSEPINVENLTTASSAQQVSQWLNAHRFSHIARKFQNFSGADILRLSRNDMIQMFDVVEGIRLYNALQIKSIHPRLTIYVCQEQTKSGRSVDIRESVLISTSSAGYWSPGSSRSSSSSNGSPSQSACIGDMPRSLSSPISPCCTSTVTPGEGKNFNQPKRKLVSDSDAETNENTTNKKRRNISEKSNVFHAIFLDYVTLRHLVEKLCNLYGIQVGQVSQVQTIGPSGIFIYVSDSVVENFPDQSRFLVRVIEDECQPGFYSFVLKPIDKS